MKNYLILFFILCSLMAQGQTKTDSTKVFTIWGDSGSRGVTTGKFNSSGRVYKGNDIQIDTVRCYIVYIDTFRNDPAFWMVGYKIIKQYANTNSDAYLDNDKKPLKSSIIVLMSKQIK